MAVGSVLTGFVGRFRWILGIAWAFVAVLAVVAAAVRYRAALPGQPDSDLDIFIAAGRAVRNGLSPYTVDGYVYSPVLAIVLAPFSGASHVAQAWAAASICAGMLAVTLVVAVHWSTLTPWARPVLALAALGTLWWSWLATWELSWGQWARNELTVACCDVDDGLSVG